MSSQSGCGKCGPGYASPLAAMSGPREKIIYIICVQPKPEETGKSDYLATVDVDPESPTYCQVIHRLHTNFVGDELHHTGWNACSSCYNMKGTKSDADVPVRNRLVMPALKSDRIFIVDTGTNPKAPKMFKVIDGADMRALNCSTPHTTHCLPSKEIMISIMGDADGNGKGDFVLVDAETLAIKGTWTNGSKRANFGYDFWYQPYFDIMVSSEWGAPRIFKRGFQPSDCLDTSTYGRSINFFSWKKRELLHTENLGDDGIAPLEVRFLHNPKKPIGFVGCAVNANVFRFYLKDDGTWVTDKVIDVKPKKVDG